MREKVKEEKQQQVKQVSTKSVAQVVCLDLLSLLSQHLILYRITQACCFIHN